VSDSGGAWCGSLTVCDGKPFGSHHKVVIAELLAIPDRTIIVNVNLSYKRKQTNNRKYSYVQYFSVTLQL